MRDRFRNMKGNNYKDLEYEFRSEVALDGG